MTRWAVVILGVLTIFAAPVAVELMADHWWAVLAGLTVLVGMFTAAARTDLT